MITKQFLLGSLIACQTWAAEPAGITVRLANPAKVSDAKLKDSQKLAAYILKTAGVHLAWEDNTFAFADWQARPRDFTFTATEFPLYVDFEKPAIAAAEMLGFTIVRRDLGSDMRAAGVYYSVVRSMAETYKVDETPILGAALAHEIGHLLGLGHATSGVMFPKLGREHFVQASGGRLVFTAAQASQLRAEVARRKAAQLRRDQ